MSPDNPWYPSEDNVSDWPEPEISPSKGNTVINSHIAGADDTGEEPIRGARKAGAPTRDLSDFRPQPQKELLFVSLITVVYVGLYIALILRPYISLATSNGLGSPDESIGTFVPGFKEFFDVLGAEKSAAAIVIVVCMSVVVIVFLLAIPARLIGPVVGLWKGSAQSRKKVQVNAAVLLIAGMIPFSTLILMTGFRGFLSITGLFAILFVLMPVVLLLVVSTGKLPEFASRRLGPNKEDLRKQWLNAG